MIVDALLLLFAAGGLYFLRTIAQSATAMRADMAATRKQAKAALRDVQRTEAHSRRVLDRAYRNKQQIDALMDSPHVKAAIEYTAKHPR